MIGRTQLLLLALLSQLPVIAAAMPDGAIWLASKRSHLSEKWSDYKRKKEIRKLTFRVCREKATHDRIAANSRAEFVHRCVRVRSNAEANGQP